MLTRKLVWLVLAAVLWGSLAGATPVPAASVSCPGITLEVFADQSLSGSSVRARQHTVIGHALGALAANDCFQVFGFGGRVDEVWPLEVVGARAGSDFAEVLTAIPSATDRYTFYSPVFVTLDRLRKERTRLYALVVTDGQGSDPLNEPARRRTGVADLDFRTAAPPSMDEVPVLWAVTDLAGVVAPDASTATLDVDPGTTLVLWKRPPRWIAPAQGTLEAWLKSLRPTVVKPLVAPVPAPGQGAALLRAVGGSLLAVLVAVLGAVLGVAGWRGVATRFGRWTEHRQRSQDERTVRSLLQATATERRTVTLYPLWRPDLPPLDRALAPETWVTVSRLEWPDLPVSLDLGRQNGTVSLRTRGAFDTLAVRRPDGVEIQVEPGSEHPVADGDVVVSAQGDMLRVELPRAGGR